jgi:glycosyltransferase involved in cell wall biosynthesis
LINIPSELHNIIDCLIIDNCSTDGSVSKITNLLNKKTLPFHIALIKTKYNLGYSGSQKLAYSLVQKSTNAKKIIMLHGDGQYPSSLLSKLQPYFGSNAAIVYGYRSKKIYKNREETPFLTYIVVKLLNSIENICTGFRFKEWHSGFVMYSVNFLKSIPLNKLTETRHIDGEMLMCAGELQERTVSVPIYKRYKGYVGFGGLSLIKYVGLHVPTVIIKNIKGHHKKILSDRSKHIDVNISDNYEIIKIYTPSLELKEDYEY